MNIIKRGIDPKEIEIEKTCKHCKTVFSDKKHEFLFVHWPRESAYTIICPVCNTTLYFDRL